MTKEFRRKAPRRHFHGQVGVLYKGYMTITTCVQLGEGGALIRLDQVLEDISEEDDIVVTLFLPHIGGVVASAQCVYVAGDNKMGVQFQNLDMRYKIRVREFVSRRKSAEVR